MARKKKETTEAKEKTAEAKIEKKEAKKEIKEIKEKAKVEKLNTESLKKDSKKIEELIIKLADEGITKSKIGMILRDKHGIPKAKLTGKKIGKVLAEKTKQKVPEDLNDLSKKAEKLRKHLEKNKQDKVAKRGLQLTEAKMKKLSNYFKKKGILPKQWKYR